MKHFTVNNLLVRVTGFRRACRKAVEHLKDFPSEETGGFVVHSARGLRLFFIPNAVPFPRRVALYEPTDDGMAQVFEYMNRYDGSLLMSVHNHPTMFSGRPSGQDLAGLFLGQPLNAIYSNRDGSFVVYRHDGTVFY